MLTTGPTPSLARRSLSALLLALALVVPTGCIETHVLPADVPMNGSSTMALVGAAGADLAIADLHVVVPAGAVASDTMISVHVDEPHVPFTAYSSVIRLEPAGLVLARPLQLQIPFRGDAARATAFVAGGAASAYAPQPTRIEGDIAVVEMTTLSSTFVGTACEGADCTCEPIGMLDLLVVVDDSNSMAEEQALLQSQFPALFRALATGDLDGDGVQDVPAFDDVRVGITTTDLGTASVAGIASCEPGYGDDGILRNAPGASAGASCTTPSYAPPYASYRAATPAGLDGFIAQVSCESALGTGGCGFEQQLEAGLLALSPNAPTTYTAMGWTVPAFPEGRMGQGDLANAGFLRDGSILAVLYVTDEDDCSTRDSGLFAVDDPRFGGVDLNLRCTTFPEQLLAVSSLVDGLVGLRPRPEDVVVGAITGVPTGIDTTDLAAVLADPSMTPRVDMTMPNGLVPVCTSTNGRAFPAQRIVQSLQGAQSAGAQVVLQSICDPSFDAFTSALAHDLAARAGGSC